MGFGVAVLTSWVGPPAPPCKLSGSAGGGALLLGLIGLVFTPGLR